MDYDSSGHIEADDGTSIFWGGRGHGRVPALFCDGIGCDGFAWKYLLPATAKTRSTLHFHYRGHGRSGLPADPARIDVPAHARDAVALLDARGIERCVLIGHSMGTQVALEVTRQAPERVAGLILICGSYGRVTATFRGSDMLKQVLPSLIENVERHRGVARALWGRMPARIVYRLASLTGELDSAAREEDFVWYLEHVSAMDPSLFLSMLRCAGEHSAEDLLASIAAPTLVVAAERDTFTPPGLATHMAEAIPQAELLMLQGASHAAPIERPEEIEARVERFFRERVDV